MSIKSIIFTVVITAAMLFNSISYADPVWIDVRSYVENKIDNIEGDMRISHSEIVSQVSEMYPDKNTEINLYCRSGGRAEKALSSLTSAGYKNVQNVGSIGEARKLRAATIAVE